MSTRGDPTPKSHPAKKVRTHVLPPESAAAAALREAQRDQCADDTISQRIEDLIARSEPISRASLTVIRGAEVGRLHELSDAEATFGRADDVTIPVADPAVSRRHAAIHSTPLGFVITDLDSTNGLFINGERSKRHVLRDGDRIQFGSSTVFKFSYQDELEESLQKRLYESATRDALLGIHNKQYFLDNLKAAFANATRKRCPLSLLMLDVDHFKQVNDDHGHIVGDQVLKRIAALVQASTRTEDVLARFGGEEFVLLLTDSAREPASLVAERIRSSIELCTFEHEGCQIHLTISIGISTYTGARLPTPESLIAEADAALYRAKRAGRNRVAWPVSPEPSETT